MAFYRNNQRAAFTSCTGITFPPGQPVSVPADHLAVMQNNPVDRFWLDKNMSEVEVEGGESLPEPAPVTPTQAPSTSPAPTPAAKAPSAAPAAPSAPAPAPQTVGAPLAAPERLERFIEIVKMLDNDDDNWTANGAPQVNALNNALEENEREFSAAERNELWNQMNA